MTMIKSDGNGGLKVDKAESISFMIKIIVITGTVLAVYFNTIGAIKTNQAVLQTKQDNLCEKIKANTDKIIQYEAKIDRIYNYIILKDTM